MTPRQDRITRRRMMQIAAAGVTFGSQCPWFDALATAADDPKRKRSMIMLWMGGGASHIDTFDPKPGEKTGGPFKFINSTVPGIRVCEHLPQVARQMKHLAVVRSMTTTEGDHRRASVLIRTGRLPEELVQYPTFGSLVSKELGDPKSELPNFISIGGRNTEDSRGSNIPGFLGPDYAPLLVGDGGSKRRGGSKDLTVPDIKPQVESERVVDRIQMMDDLNAEFAAGREGEARASAESAYARALRLSTGSASAAFNLDREPEKLRDAYGRNAFGQGCLMARRLVERGVPFVEVSFGGQGWDSHFRNFPWVQENCAVLDPAWATLMEDLAVRGLLETTTVFWMGEFGRSPFINGLQGGGREHYPNAWSLVLGGGGIKGGQAYGKTDRLGGTVEDKPVSAPDLLATLCKAIGVDYVKENISNVNRPISIVEKTAKPVTEVLA
ncbi:DUF1501 domain-containing protein [Zavarzinella formosa]|uniref:DUF1501 domain-containing protein n=1 Tax=Zavarzinella formosa TaxID=360055 RepID=UPI000316DB55|nr:DUF1501 domain-containing protein [Zavarzinella formosa]